MGHGASSVNKGEKPEAGAKVSDGSPFEDNPFDDSPFDDMGGGGDLSAMMGSPGSEAPTHTEDGKKMSVKRLKKMAMGKKEYEYNARAHLNHNKVDEISFDPGKPTAVAGKGPRPLRPAPPPNRPANAVRGAPGRGAGTQSRPSSSGLPARPAMRPTGVPRPHVPPLRHGAGKGQAGMVATFAPSTMGIPTGPIEGPPPGYAAPEPEPGPTHDYYAEALPSSSAAGVGGAGASESQEGAPIYHNPNPDPLPEQATESNNIAPTGAQQLTVMTTASSTASAASPFGRGKVDLAAGDASSDEDFMDTDGDVEVYDWTAMTTTGAKGDSATTTSAQTESSLSGIAEYDKDTKEVADEKTSSPRGAVAPSSSSSSRGGEIKSSLTIETGDEDAMGTLGSGPLPLDEMIANFSTEEAITPSQPKIVPSLSIPPTPTNGKPSYKVATSTPPTKPPDQPSLPKPKGPAPVTLKTPKRDVTSSTPPSTPPSGSGARGAAGMISPTAQTTLNSLSINTLTPVGPKILANRSGAPTPVATGGRRAAPPSGPAPPSAATPTPGSSIRKTSIIAQPPSRPTISPHAVKETKDVKRNRAQLPSNTKHNAPIKGDWLKKRYIVNNYILLDTLGTGSYGEVRMCKDRTTDHMYAIKIISKDMLKKKKGGNTSETYFEDIKREIAIMKKLLHPNVLRLYEVLDDPKVNKLYLLVEYMKDGDLVHVLKQREDATGYMTLGDVELWNVFRQVAAGVRYLHYQNVVHGDIKPQNILVEDQYVKIADFGISKMLHASGQKVTDAAGTPAFMSPELCAGESHSGQLADIWALGGTMFMLKYGFPPFRASNIINLYKKIQEDALEFPDEPPINPGLQNLLESMLEKNPKKRATLQQTLQHPWLRSPPTYAVNSSKTGSASNTITAGSGFAPGEGYEKAEEDAMRKGVQTVNEDDMFMSIGAGASKAPKKKGSFKASDAGKVDDDDDDIMATKWGEDEFEMIDDDDDYNSDSDDNDVDATEKQLWNETTSTAADENSSASHVKQVSSSSMFDTGNSSKHGSMDKHEEEARTLRFKKLTGKRSVVDLREGSEGELGAKGEGKTVDIESGAKASKGEDTFEFFNSKDTDDSNTPKGNPSDNVTTASSTGIPSNGNTAAFKESLRVEGADKGGSSGNTLAGRRSLLALNPDNPVQPSGMFTSESHPAPLTPAATTSKFNPLGSPLSRSSPNRRRSTLKTGIDDEDTTTLDFGDFEKLMDTLQQQPVQEDEDDDEGEDESMLGDSIDAMEQMRITPALSQLVPSAGPEQQLRNLETGLGTAFYSEQGSRDANEDRCLLIPNLSKLDTQLRIDTPSDKAEGKDDEALRDTALKKLSMGCIFDGHSGHRASQLLSQHFASYLLNHPRFFDKGGKGIETAIVETCKDMDKELCELLVRESDLSGSTCVCAVYDGRNKKFTIGNIGDSMCILSRGGRAVKMHRQHRLGGGIGDVDERKRVESAGGRVLNSRVNGVLAISRAFGDVQLKDYNTGVNQGPVIAVPDVVSEIITPMTEFAVIGTDGLYDTMEPQQVVNFVRQRISKKETTLQETAQALTREAISRGSIDNVSVILFSFHL